MKADNRLRTVIFTMLNSFDKNKIYTSLQQILDYIISSKQLNLIDLIVKKEHLLGNSMLLIISSFFLIVLHFINIL